MTHGQTTERKIYTGLISYLIQFINPIIRDEVASMIDDEIQKGGNTMTHGQTTTIQNSTLASALAALEQDDKDWPTSLTIQQAEALLVDRLRLKAEIKRLKQIIADDDESTELWREWVKLVGW